MNVDFSLKFFGENKIVQTNLSMSCLELYGLSTDIYMLLLTLWPYRY